MPDLEQKGRCCDSRLILFPVKNIYAAVPASSRLGAARRMVGKKAAFNQEQMSSRGFLNKAHRKIIYTEKTQEIRSVTRTIC